MEESKFENNLRKKFEERRIEPSLNSWIKLESELKKSQPKKNNKWILYVAACLIGILIPTSFFINQKPNVENETIVIEDSKPQNPVEDIVEIDEKNAVVNAIQKKEVIQTPISESKKTVTEIKEKNQKPTESKLSEEDEKMINEWAMQVANSIKSLPDSSDEELINEVENLLESARKEMFAQKIIQNSTVDATALLDEVEWELDRDFREKIFDFLGDKYEKIKTALSLQHD